MIKNFTRLNNAVNNAEARKAFRRAVILAIQYAIDSPANRLIFIDPATVTWRKLDKMTEELMTAINDCGANPPISWDNLFDAAAIVNAPPDN